MYTEWKTNSGKKKKIKPSRTKQTHQQTTRKQIADCFGYTEITEDLNEGCKYYSLPYK